MNKKIYFNFLCFCIISSLIIVIFSGFLFGAGRIENYRKDLYKYMMSFAESDLSASVSELLNSSIDEKERASMINDTVSLYEGKLSLNENRSFYILNESDLKVIYPLRLLGEEIYPTENINLSKRGEKGDTFKLSDDYIDCSYMINCGDFGKCLFYVRDNKSDLRFEIYDVIIKMLWLFIPAFLLSLLLALILSRRITVPLKKITKRAEGLKKGELYENIDDINYDELKELFKSVNNMGYVMAESVRQMKDDKQRFDVITERVNNGIMTFNSERRLIQINSAAKRILNINDENIDFDEFFNSIGISIRMTEIQFLEKETVIEKEIKNNNEYIKVWFIPYKPENEKLGVICVLDDVTNQFNVTETMQKFVADVSHELKTPITVIRSYTETVLNSYLDDKAMSANLLNIVYEESGKMNELVQNLLDISRYSMKDVPRKNEPFSIDEMLNSLVDTFKLEAEKKELDMTYTRMTDIPMFVGSSADMERAVKNIISNSIKYTSRGDKIRIFAGRLNNDIYIKVEDTGWGIPESKLGHLFERFYRVEGEARSRDKGGTGLGLSIAKEIIENHKGKIKIESEYTKYTRVTITLPVS